MLLDKLSGFASLGDVQSIHRVNRCFLVVEATVAKRDEFWAPFLGGDADDVDEGSSCDDIWEPFPVGDVA